MRTLAWITLIILSMAYFGIPFGSAQSKPKGKAAHPTELDSAVQELKVAAEHLQAAVAQFAETKGDKATQEVKTAGQKIEAGLAQMLSGVGDALHSAARSLESRSKTKAAPGT